MTEMTAAQLKAEHLRLLGPEAGGIYNALWNEVVELHWEWQQYLKLFAQPQKGVDALNEAAGAFFYLAQHALWQHIVLSIACLTDRPQSMGKADKRNLTVRSLSGEMTTDSAFAQEFHELIASRASSWAFAKDWRHKYLAHRDLDTALGRAVPLPAIGRSDVEGALSALREILNLIHEVHFGGSVLFEGLHRIGYARVISRNETRRGRPVAVAAPDVRTVPARVHCPSGGSSARGGEALCGGELADRLGEALGTARAHRQIPPRARIVQQVEARREPRDAALPLVRSRLRACLGTHGLVAGIEEPRRVGGVGGAVLVGAAEHGQEREGERERPHAPEASIRTRPERAD